MSPFEYDWNTRDHTNALGGGGADLLIENIHRQRRWETDSVLLLSLGTSNVTWFCGLITLRLCKAPKATVTSFDDLNHLAVCWTCRKMFSCHVGWAGCTGRC